MSYADMNVLYHDHTERGRFDMCIRQQGYIFSADGRPDIAALGMGIVGGDLADIDAVIGAIVTGENSADLGEDGPLLSAVQSVWPTVAAARYPQEVAP
jgi:hypothetical protein